MKSKALYWIGGCLVAVILLAGAFSGGLLTGRLVFGGQATSPVSAPAPAQPSTLPEGHPSVAPTPTAPVRDYGDANFQKMVDGLWEVWQIVHDQYVEQPVNEEKMIYGAIGGMLDALGDPHTSYMDPDQYTQANIPLEGEYEGIGAWVDPNGEYLTIVSPMPGSPAEKAGLKPGDEVIAVDGEDMTGVDGNLVIRKVLGPAGTQVTLTIRRKGVPKPFDVTITRAKITIPSVEYHMIEGTNIAYVQLFQFGQNSDRELRKALEEMLAQNPDALILDLRNNGGGYLNTAVEVASEFLSDGVVLYEDFGDGTRNTYKVKPGGVATEIPLVVLVNEGTASASEIVAGAIQDYGRGLLVGTRTFGKGSVQNWVPLRSDVGGAARVTIAHWLTPKERLIHGKGLEPDVVLAVFTQEQWDAGVDLEELGLTEDQVVILSDEDVQNGVDPQLDKAIELIQSGRVK